MPLHDWSLARDAVIISHRYYANSIGYPSASASSSKWHAWFASCCPGRLLSTWPTTAVTCPTALGALCNQLMIRLVWCREHSVVMTELLQPRDLACGTLFQSSCIILTSWHHLWTVPMTAEGTPFSGSMNTVLCDYWYMRRHRKTLTYFLASKVTTLRSYINTLIVIITTCTKNLVKTGV